MDRPLVGRLRGRLRARLRQSASTIRSFVAECMKSTQASHDLKNDRVPRPPDRAGLVGCLACR